MDSLTQIVLGAAMGELAAGKQLGNRAMFWGAVAGTIPDFDVTASWVAGPLSSLAFHRAVTHSLYYTLLASPILAYMVQGLYADDGQPDRHYLQRFWLAGTAAIYLIIVLGSFLSPTPFREVWSYAAVVALMTTLVPLLVWAYRRWKPRIGTVRMGFWRWCLLFLLGIGTHPLLDCFTTYGTQVFQPFSDLRVAWNSISVVDPLYTLPLLICLLVAARLLRGSTSRRYWLRAGLGVSTAYLLFTCLHLLSIRSRVKHDLAAAGINYERFIVTPTLFQNILWQVTVDQGDTLRSGKLGRLDDPFRLDVRQMHAYPRRDYLLEPIAKERAVRIARWFSNGYYAVEPGPADTLNFMDLRFGTLPGKTASPLFVFQLFPQPNSGEWGFRQRPVQDENLDLKKSVSQLTDRIRGIRR